MSRPLREDSLKQLRKLMEDVSSYQRIGTPESLIDSYYYLGLKCILLSLKPPKEEQVVCKNCGFEIYED